MTRALYEHSRGFRGVLGSPADDEIENEYVACADLLRSVTHQPLSHTGGWLGAEPHRRQISVCAGREEGPVVAFAKASADSSRITGLVREKRTITVVNAENGLLAPELLAARYVGNVFVIATRAIAGRRPPLPSRPKLPAPVLELVVRLAGLTVESTTDPETDQSSLRDVLDSLYRRRRTSEALHSAGTKALDNLPRLSFSHGDLTPWNVILTRGHSGARAIDWADCAYRPRGYDLFHYLVQHAAGARTRLDDSARLDELVRTAIEASGALDLSLEQCLGSFVCYLLRTVGSMSPQSIDLPSYETSLRIALLERVTRVDTRESV